MPLLQARRSPSRDRFVAQIAAGSSFVLGLTALIGWWLNLDAFKCLVPGSTPLKPNIAVGFCLGGFALLFLCWDKLPKAARLFAQFAAVLVAALGAVTLSQYLFGRDLGIDRWLIRAFPSSMGLTTPG